MKICYLLLILFVGFVRAREEGTGPVPCFPTCPLSEEGRRLCESLLILEPCIDRNKQQGEDGPIICSCEWSAVLSHPGYSHVLDSSECLQYSLNTCDTKIRQSRGTTTSGYSASDFLREIQNENSRIEKLTDESKKRDAKTKLLNTVRDIIELTSLYDASNKGNSTSKDTGKTGATDSNRDPDRTLKGGWRKPMIATKQRSVKMSPLKDDKRFHIAMFAAVVMLILLIIILCLLAKIKTDRSGVNLDIVGDLDLDNRRLQSSSLSTLLDKLRLRYREKAQENGRRGQSTGGVISQNKIAKPPMTVPSNSSLGRRNSNTSLKSGVDKRTDSCTMISGLTHGNTTGSDVEIDNEFRMFRTNFKEDFKSLLNVNQNKQERH